MKDEDVLEHAADGKSVIGVGDQALIREDHCAERSSATEYSLAEFLKIKGRDFEEKWISDKRN